MTFLDELKEDHSRLLAEVRKLEEILNPMKAPLNPPARERFLEFLKNLTDLLEAHVELESNQFFSRLRSVLPEKDQWQLRMMEVQDEMILNQVKRLYEMASAAPHCISVTQLKDSGMHLTRWIREHIIIEEEHLFPKF